MWPTQSVSRSVGGWYLLRQEVCWWVVHSSSMYKVGTDCVCVQLNPPTWMPVGLLVGGGIAYLTFQENEIHEVLVSIQGLISITIATGAQSLLFDLITL